MAGTRTRTPKLKQEDTALVNGVDTGAEGDIDLPEVVEDEDEEGALVEADGGASEESVESLREQLEAANQRAAEAEERASKTSGEVAKTQAELIAANVQVIKNAVEAQEGEKRELLAKITEAKQSGDYAGEAEALDKLQQVNIKLARMQEGLSELERRAEDEKSAPADPVERYVQGMAPRAQAWIRKHAEVVTDPEKNEELVAAHFAAKGERLVEGTDAYFQFIEQRLGYSKAPAREQEQEQRSTSVAATTTRRPSPAPASRTPSVSSAPLPKGVTLEADGRYRLSPAHREAARISGISDREYLDNLLALNKEGAFSRQLN